VSVSSAFAYVPAHPLGGARSSVLRRGGAAARVRDPSRRAWVATLAMPQPGTARGIDLGAMRDKAAERSKRALRSKLLGALIGTPVPDEWLAEGAGKVTRSTPECSFAPQEMAVMWGAQCTIVRVQLRDDDDGMYCVETEMGAHGSRAIRRVGRAKMCKVDQALVERLAGLE